MSFFQRYMTRRPANNDPPPAYRPPSPTPTYHTVDDHPHTAKRATSVLPAERSKEDLKPSTRDPWSQTPTASAIETITKAQITTAIQHDNARQVLMLMRAGFDPNSQLRGGDTALHMAVKLGRAWIVTILLNADAYPDIRDRNGITPLHLAVELGNTAASIAITLLEAGADVDAITAAGRPSTPLDLAFDAGHPAMAMVLLEYGADPARRNARGWMPMHYASTWKHASVVTKLLEKGAGVNEPTWSTTPETCLQLAAERGRKEVVELLLDGGAVVNVAHTDNKNRTALLRAARNGFGDVVTLLLEAGADIRPTDREGRMVLHYLAAKNDFQNLDLLFKLHKKVDVNASDHMGWTALHMAAYHGCLGATTRLLKNGAGPDALDAFRSTALHQAAIWGYSGVAKALLDANARFDVENEYGVTALGQARLKNRHDIVALMEVQLSR
ncbi:ankyrin repeat-containing domain protein [Aspergillus karnatakaensis]|uniref:ankyrin repeat domain-containing protein n=1 Tax=Aspergillus karnatakaensis TaxID=1810916 RepID=UPI003CCCDC74